VEKQSERKGGRERERERETDRAARVHAKPKRRRSVLASSLGVAVVRTCELRDAMIR